jgi:hypothetical protein
MLHLRRKKKKKKELLVGLECQSALSEGLDLTLQKATGSQSPGNPHTGGLHTEPMWPGKQDTHRNIQGGRQKYQPGRKARMNNNESFL